MKIYKKNEHSLLIKPFGLKDKLYLATTVLIFFDLENPDPPLTEQDLWSTVPDQLGPQAVLDMGMAKPRGEVLATGSCHAPRGTTRSAAQVSIKVGAVEKQLHVFGDRHWTRAGGAVSVISDPRPFAEIPITYENAFGGKDFERNPVGKGVAPVSAADGQTYHPLPNIELPGQLVGAPGDRPEPAGFGPLDLLWPQRAEKQGTYDQQWLQERWPYFPADMDYEFFNAAPADQFITGFFSGGEQIEIVNMHPDIQAIRSHLPALRIRCFATKKTSLKPGHAQDEVFEEVPLHIDTVHLFPSILRGVLMYRGTTEILDDEYADVRRIYLATEGRDEAPRSLEFYLEAQKKAMDRTVPMDQAPLEAAKKKIDDAHKRISALPKEIHAMKQRALGRSPRMPAPTASEMKDQADTMLAGHLALVDKLEAQARQMHAKWGHMAAVPLHQFDALRNQLKETGRRVAKGQEKLDAARDKTDAVKQEVAGQLKARVKPEDLAKAGIDPDNLLAPKPVNPWHDNGFPFVVQCRKALARDAAAMAGLNGLGLSRRTVQRAWLGINPEAQESEDRTAWGLDPKQDDQGRPVPLVLPPGLVMPRFDGPVLNRILIRSQRDDRTEPEALIEGSDETPLFLPAAGLMDLPGAPAAPNAPCVRVADELQALLVEQEAGDLCSVIALDAPDRQPGKDAADALAAAPVLLVLLPETDVGEGQWAAWTRAFSNAQKLILPHGDTVFDARRQGTDILELILAALPAKTGPSDGQTRESGPAALSSNAGLPGPLPDIKAMVQGLMQEVRDLHQPRFDALREEKKAAENRAREAIVKAGKDPDQVLAAAAGQPKMSLTEAGETIARKIDAQHEKLKKAGHLTPELEERMKTKAAAAVRMGRDGDRRLAEGQAKLEDARRQSAALKEMQIPAEMKAKLAGYGVDPDKLKKLTRQEVIDRHSRGESLSEALLSGVDLSGLDLQGIDLRKAQCLKTNFTGANLTGADLSQALAREADFSQACLHGLRSDKGVFIKAVFKQADLSEADLRMAVFKGADLSEADLSRSKLHMSVLEKATLAKTRFAEAAVSMSVFTGARAVDTDFTGARLDKCVFQKAVLDRADFSGAVLKATMFYAATGTSVRFAGADMSKSRMGGNTHLAGADFTGIRMIQGCFKDANLSGADFTGARIDSAMLENCDLTGANFFKVYTVKTRFSKSNLENANMRGVNLFLGSLRKARLVNTDLRDSNLYGVDVYKAVFGHTRLDGANIKKTLLQGRTEYLS